MTQLLELGNIVFRGVYIAKGGAEIPVEISARIMGYLGQPAIVGITRDVV